MKIRLLHPITHNGLHYSRGIHDIEQTIAEELLGVHSPECTSFEAKTKDSPEKPNGECRNHSAVPFVEVNPVIGTVTADPGSKKPDPKEPPKEAGIKAPEPPDTTQPGSVSFEPGREPQPVKQEPPAAAVTTGKKK